MTEREEFESWARSERLPDDRSGEGYAWHDVQLRWEGWQARAALAQPVAAEPEQDPCQPTDAAGANWHRAMSGLTDMRPGHKEGIDGAPAERAR